MKIDIRVGADKAVNEKRSYIERRLDVITSRFARRIDSISVCLNGSDDGPPAGNETCEIKVRLVPSGICITRQSRDSDCYAAIDRAIDGLCKSFAKAG
jgi:ribosome-associated translation inhibitor RaiA